MQWLHGDIENIGLNMRKAHKRNIKTEMQKKKKKDSRKTQELWHMKVELISLMFGALVWLGSFKVYNVRASLFEGIHVLSCHSET